MGNGEGTTVLDLRSKEKTGNISLTAKNHIYLIRCLHFVKIALCSLKNFLAHKLIIDITKHQESVQIPHRKSRESWRVFI